MKNLFRASRGGVTLIEIIITMLITLIGILAFYQAYVYGNEILFQQRLRRNALMKAKSDLEIFRAYIKEHSDDQERSREFKYLLGTRGEEEIVSTVTWTRDTYMSKSTVADGFGIVPIGVSVAWDGDGDDSIDDNVTLYYDVPVTRTY